MIGYAICGSFCTHARSLSVLRTLAAEGHDILPILSPISATTDTRFGRASDLCRAVTDICGHPPVVSVAEAEPLGPARPLETLIIAPCTGNTLAKIAHGITDTSVTMAAKAHLRADRPLLIALASNDAMATGLGNIGGLLLRKSVYFVPMRQDDPQAKPHSLVACLERLPEALAAMQNSDPARRQLRPLFLE